MASNPFTLAFYMYAKPVGSACNMSCDYCYYSDKKSLLPGASPQRMSGRLLEKYVREYIQCQSVGEVQFVWHGGEPLLLPLSFYERTMQLQRRYAGGRNIYNVLQTNGTLLDDRWCEFLARNGWLVGVSIDGPEELHDEYRRMRGDKPSFKQVMNGIRLLDKHGVAWNAMVAVNDLNASHPRALYRFFKEMECHYIQLTPVVERTVETADGSRIASVDEGDGKLGLAHWSVGAEQWGYFLCRLFDEWVRSDVGVYYINYFDATLTNWCGYVPGICSLDATCGHVGIIEANGDVYSCDHFVFPQYRLGNLWEEGFPTMMYGKRQQAFGRAKSDSLPRLCKVCRWLFACHGECPKNRFCHTADGQPGLNYLCRGYRMFFEHVAPYMDFMCREVKTGGAPANVMYSDLVKRL